MQRPPAQASPPTTVLWKLISWSTHSALPAASSSHASTSERHASGSHHAIAELEYDLALDEVSVRDHDAQMRNGRRVQIKATFKDSLTFTTCPDYYLGFKLYPDGGFEEVFNGPGMLILKKFSHRKDIGKKLLSFPITGLRALSDQVDVADRVPRRKGLASSGDGRGRDAGERLARVSAVSRGGR